MENKIVLHEKNCAKERAIERTSLINENIKPPVDILHGRINKVREELKDNDKKTDEVHYKFTELTKLQNSMNEDVKDIKKSIKTIEVFILTSPQKFADKKETQKFISGINTKIAWVSGVFFTISTIIGFLLNKFF